VILVASGVVRAGHDRFVSFNVLVLGISAIAALVVSVPAVVLAVRAHRRDCRPAASRAVALSTAALGCAVTALFPAVVLFVEVQHCYSSGQCW